MGSRLLPVVALLVTVTTSAFGCAPVVPDVAYDVDEFEGHTVYSHLPADPVGVVFLFHGSGGSAAFATKIETVEVVNELIGRGYGVVATDSTQRTGDRRWDVADADMTTNPDLARLARLHDELIATTPVGRDTPLFGIGMSNGARMVTLFAESFTSADRAVAAIAVVNGPVARPVDDAGGLTVPAFFVVNENDTIVDRDRIEADVEEAAANGTPVRLVVKYEESLSPARFTRVPTIDEQEAVAIHDVLAATGVWDGDGRRVVDIDTAIDVLQDVELPPSVAGDGPAIRNQVSALLALHQFTGLHRVSLVDFFDLQHP